MLFLLLCMHIPRELAIHSLITKFLLSRSPILKMANYRLFAMRETRFHL